MIIRPIRFFTKNRKGSAAIEFAVIALPFFLLLVGIIEIGLTVFVDSSLNSGVRAAARQGVATGYTNKSEIGAIMKNHMAGIYRDITTSGSKIDFRMVVVNDVADIPSQNPEVFFQSPQSSLPTLDSQKGKVVIYAAKYQWDGFTKLMAPFLPDNLYAVTVVKNEAF